MITRRAFLLGIGAAGVIVGCSAVRRDLVDATGEAQGSAGDRRAAVTHWLEFRGDGRVRLHHLTTDLGQATPTSLAWLVADQLGMGLERFDLVQAPASPPFLEDDGYYGTSSSSGLRMQFEEMRKLGATAAALFRAAAASAWDVPVDQCELAEGEVLHRQSGRSVPMTRLLDRVAELPIPSDVAPRSTSRSGVSGPMLRIGAPAMVTGAATYGIDVSLPGMKTAVLVQPPVIGARVMRFDATRALAMRGVEQVFATVDGVAVVASSFWFARRASELMEVEWELPRDSPGDSVDLRERLLAAVRGEDGIELPSGAPQSDADVPSATPDSAPHDAIEAEYELPLAAHAAMEPLSATAWIRDGRCELWIGTQSQSLVRASVARELGLAPIAVTLHPVAVGGSFGRRLEPDLALQVVRIARAVGAPVKLVWTREQDMRHGYYRTAAAIRMAATLDADGRPTAWSAYAACGSIRDTAPSAAEPGARASTIWR